MKVIIVTEKDAANASMSKIANAFLKKHHQVRVYAPYYEEYLLAGFDAAIDKYRFDQLDEEACDWCDLIFSTSISAAFFLKKYILKLKKPIFTHSYLINGQVNWGGDLCFVSSLDLGKTDFDDVIKSIKFSIGEPKYDSYHTKGAYDDNKTLLFIDSGHYPFGNTGKHKLAKCLLSICNRFPEYKLVIKPRFLPSDKVITHRNMLNLYDVMMNECKGCFPENIIFLDKHYDLMDLIDNSRTVICLYTSAFVGACVANKGLIVLDGIDSKDVYDVRLKQFNRIKEKISYTNAIIPYDKIFDFLPDGTHNYSDSISHLFEEQSNVSEKICEVTEYIVNNYFDKGIFPHIKDYEYKDYLNSMNADPTLDWDKIIELRIKNLILQRLLIHIDFNLSTVIDTSYIKKYVNDLCIDHIDLDEIIKCFPTIRSKCIVQNRDLLLKDDIDSGVLLNAYYILKEYDNILNFDNHKIGSFWLFSAFVYHDRGDDDKSYECLMRYFEISNNRMYIEEISDMSENRFRAFRMMIIMCEFRNDIDKAGEYLNHLIEYYKINYLSELDDAPKGSGQRNQLAFINKHIKLINQ